MSVQVNFKLFLVFCHVLAAREETYSALVAAYLIVLQVSVFSKMLLTVKALYSLLLGTLGNVANINDFSYFRGRNQKLAAVIV
jgi:hypothetical protein